MAEKPILFSTDMVKAILEGRKTQTRRVITVHWHKGTRTTPYEPYYIESDGKLLYMDEYGDYHPMENVCPHGRPGTVLWVRETWCPGYYADGRVGYKADWQNPDPRVVAETNWKPPIHMPREAARLFLEVKSVRVERLQDITPEDCEAEGMDAYCDDGVHDPGDAMYLQFSELWDSINGNRGYGWDKNPWVWVVEFKRVEVSE